MLVGCCLLNALAFQAFVPFAAPTVAVTPMIKVEGTRNTRPLPPLTAREQAHEQALRVHVETIAAKIGERSSAHPRGLAETVGWLERELRAAGLLPRRLPYKADGKTYVNLEASVAGQARCGGGGFCV